MVRTERESDSSRREMAALLVLPRPAKSVKYGAGFREKLKHTGPAEKERVASVPQREQLARTLEAPLPRRKRNRAPSVQSTRLWGRRESQGGGEPHLGEREGDQSESMEGEGWTPR